MEEPNKFRRPKARLKTANATQGVNEAPSKSASSLKTNYELQIVNIKLENKIEKLEEKLLEKENRIAELTAQNIELVEELDEYENDDQLADEPQASTATEQIIAQFAPPLLGYLEKMFQNKQEQHEYNMIIARNAAERIRMQKEQGIGNGE